MQPGSDFMYAHTSSGFPGIKRQWKSPDYLACNALTRKPDGSLGNKVNADLNFLKISIMPGLHRSNIPEICMVS